jgi:phosphatidylglycerophosphatase A
LRNGSCPLTRAFISYENCIKKKIRVVSRNIVISTGIVLFLFIDSLKPGGAVVASNEPENEWKEQKKKFHSHLAKFFMKQPFCQRTMEELPWQLLMSGDINSLVQVLTNPM